MVTLSLVVGVLAGLAARILESGVQLGMTHVIGRVVDPSTPQLLRPHPGVLLLPTLGGLLSGLIVTFLCRPHGAHGTAVLIDAFHNRRAQMSVRDASLRALAAMLVIAFGGSVGKEAPIAVLGAAIGSRMGALLALSAHERRILLVAGCAAGVGAIFQCPLGGALFATTVLYREPVIEARGLIPSIVASVISYSTFMAFGGYGHRLLSGTGSLTFTSPIELVVYVLLAGACAGTAILFAKSLRFVDGLTVRRRLPAWLAPVLAGLIGGAIAMAVPQIMDSRYQFIQHVVDGRLLRAPGHPPFIFWVLLFAAVILAKVVATALMMGARSAGGLFGPVVFIGGATGALLGALLRALLPQSFPEPLRQALIPVGMAGVLAAALRTPLAAIVMVTEMTGSYGLIVPLMLVSVVAYALGRRHGVYEEQVAGLDDSPAHAGEQLVSLLHTWRAGDFAGADWPFRVAPGTTVVELVRKMPVGTLPTFAVVDPKGRLLGVLPTGLIAAALEEAKAAPVIAADMMVEPSELLYEDDELYTALSLFRRHQVDVLPVVERDSLTFLGMITRMAILEALRTHMRERRERLLTEHDALAALDHESQLEGLLGEISAQTQRQALQRLPVPEDAIGKSLRESNFRLRYGWQVIGIETAAGELLAPADPQRPLGAGEVLVALPSRETPPAL